MAYTQLKGQIFKRNGVNYLVVANNDFTADTITVKSVDPHQSVCEMPVREVLQAVSYPPGRAPAGARW